MHKLLTPKVARLGRPDVPPETDAVAPSFSEGTPKSLKADLIDLLGKTQALSKAIDLVRFASDASPYRYIPQVVVRPKSVEDIQKIFRCCTTTNVTPPSEEVAQASAANRKLTISSSMFHTIGTSGRSWMEVNA
jgi:hypothetical protein